MNVQVQSRTAAAERYVPFETVASVEGAQKTSTPYEVAMPGYRELSIEEMLADPVVRALMSADGVQANELETLLRSVENLLRARSLKDGKGILEGEEAA